MPPTLGLSAEEAGVSVDDSRELPKIRDEPCVLSLEQKLMKLKLKSAVEDTQRAVDAALVALSDVVKTPMGIEDDDCADPEQEAKLWCCFAHVYKEEVLKMSTDGICPVSQDKKRQILADILVWAEITAPGYDQAAASFIMGPHLGDDSFKRIGDNLTASKRKAGLMK